METREDAPRPLRQMRRLDLLACLITRYPSADHGKLGAMSRDMLLTWEAEQRYLPRGR